MKKSRIFAAFSALILLVSCGSAPQPQTDAKKEITPAPTGGKVESSIFGRNVSYDGFTPAENISLPVKSGEITDTVELEKTLYFLTDGAVYYLDIESGEQGRLFDTGAKMIAGAGGSIFTYDPEGGSLCEYSPSGELAAETALNIAAEDFEPQQLFVTDSYFDFICRDSSGEFSVTQHCVYDRLTFEQVNNVSEGKSYFDASCFRSFGGYKGDKILKVEESLNDSRFVNIIEIDLESGKEKRLADFEVGVRDAYSYVLDFSYSEKTDTVLLFAAPKSGVSPVDGFTPYVTECSLSDPDNLLLKRYYLENPVCDRVFISVYENIVSLIAAPNKGIYFYDYLNPPESITLACSIVGSYSDIIRKFEEDTGVTVKTVSYGLDFDRLDVKLMAGDTDFDLYEPVSMNRVKYFLSGMFEDLSQYEGLKKRLDGSPAAGYIADFGGKYVGMPTYTYNFTDPADYEDEYMTSDYSKIASEYLYLAQNVDITEGRFDDPDGGKLYKLLKFLYDNPEGNESKMPFGKELWLMDAGFIIMNPCSRKKDNAAKFLEYVFDCSSGSAEGFENRYKSPESFDGVYKMWRCFSPEYTQPILTACARVAQCDGKSSTIKQLAREAAAEVLMRVGE